MGPPQWVPSWDTWRYLRASVISEYLVTIPKKAANHIQKTAPGPPVKMAPVTPAMLPVPTVPARAVVTAWNLSLIHILREQTESREAHLASQKEFFEKREEAAGRMGLLDKEDVYKRQDHGPRLSHPLRTGAGAGRQKNRAAGGKNHL